MNSYIMAAGLATRLRPVTNDVPKCLLPILGIPILDYWLDAVVNSFSFSKIYVNVHHCAQKVRDRIGLYNSRHKADVRIIGEESRLLGTAGTLFWHRDIGEDFMVAYADTFSSGFFLDLADIAKFWANCPDKPLASLVTFDLSDDRSSSALEIDKFGTITKFSEKSSDGIAAWAGIAFCRGDFYEYIRREDVDLARDVFPRLLGRMKFLKHIEAYDIGRSAAKYESVK